MKISVNDKEAFSLSEVQEKVIKNDVDERFFEEDMKRRLHWVLNQKYEESLRRLRQEWEPKMKSRMAYMPTSDEEFAKVVFSQHDYKDRAHRERVK